MNELILNKVGGSALQKITKKPMRSQRFFKNVIYFSRIPGCFQSKYSKVFATGHLN